jgi:protocatechuate 3,4-dioxygenase beta subunit
MKRIGIGVLALLTLLVIVGLLRALQPARAQDEVQKGWVEGTVVDEDGKPVYAAVHVQQDGKDIVADFTDTRAGGRYSYRNLKPGIYEIEIKRAEKYRPVHIFGVLVKPGVRCVIPPVVEHEGETVREIGQPAVATLKVLILSEEIDRLKAQIEELKKTTCNCKK